MSNSSKITSVLVLLILIMGISSCSTYKKAAVAPKVNQSDGLQEDWDEDSIKAEEKIFEEPDPSLTG